MVSHRKRTIQYTVFFPYHAVNTYHIIPQTYRTIYCVFSLTIPPTHTIQHGLSPIYHTTNISHIPYDRVCSIQYFKPCSTSTPCTNIIKISHQFYKKSNYLNSRGSPLLQTAGERSMSWMVAQLYIVVASRPTRGQREAHLSVARLQLIINMRPIGAHSVRASRWVRTHKDYSSSGTAATPAAAAAAVVVTLL